MMMAGLVQHVVLGLVPVAGSVLAVSVLRRMTAYLVCQMPIEVLKLVKDRVDVHVCQTGIQLHFVQHILVFVILPVVHV